MNTLEGKSTIAAYGLIVFLSIRYSSIFSLALSKQRNQFIVWYLSLNLPLMDSTNGLSIGSQALKNPR
jgi:hypothetical protein